MRLFSLLMLAVIQTVNAQERYILETSRLDSTEHEVRQIGGKVLRRMEVIKGVVTDLPEGAARALARKIPGLKLHPDIELNLVDRATASGKPGGTVTPPPQQIPWGIAAVRAREANQITQGYGVKVCIVDTGITTNHPDLKANIVGGRNFVFNKGLVDPNGYEDDNGHGSHVAGIIAAVDNNIGTVGVAPQASLYAVKVLNRQGSGRLSDIADGVHECVVKGAKVINMSLGGNADPTQDSPFKTAVQEAVLNGVRVVVAAGNEGQDMNNTVPAGFPETIAVAAVDSSLNFASWSNYGLRAGDYSAPGVSIFSTWKDGGYSTISGTSMASPHVAGVLALQISAASSGLVASDLGQPVSRQGSGFIDALATVLNHVLF